ncbi:MAG TPA: MFS transporter, partial [Thermomicrobiales bacterium]|nr:MFS transporter [Thermomicrobiales bacterium]
MRDRLGYPCRTAWAATGSRWDTLHMLPKGNPTGTGHDAYEALRSPNFRFLIAGSFLNSLATAILSVIVGFELYDRTGSALALGMVGLVQIVPNVLLSIPAGQIVDRYDQKR